MMLTECRNNVNCVNWILVLLLAFYVTIVDSRLGKFIFPLCHVVREKVLVIGATNR